MSTALTLEDCRNTTGGPQTPTLAHDAENRLVQVSGPGLSAQFTYDGNGRRVLSTVNGVTTAFVGNHYEVIGGSITKYYFAGASRVAMRQDGTLYFLLSDHLGSTSLTLDADGNKLAGLRYTAWGAVRHADGVTPTPYTFTGQYSHMAQFGLMFFNARWLDPALGRFAQADTIIPEASQGVQAWDRYAFVNNNPVRYNDPTGHDVGCPGEEASNCEAPLPIEPLIVLTRTPSPYTVYPPIYTSGTRTPPSYTQPPTVTASPSILSTPIMPPPTTPSIETPKTPKPVPVAPGTKKQPMLKLGLRPAEPDWVDVSIDVFGIIGDLAAIHAPGPGTLVDAVATGTEIVGTTKHFDDLEIGQFSVIGDIGFDIGGLLIDTLRIPPLYGSVFSAVDLTLNFCPTLYLYYQSPQR